jgi:hypothetical protein
MNVLYFSPAMMNKRFAAAIILALTVLFSQGGGTVLAAICPHLRSLANACHEMPGAVSDPQTHHSTGETRKEQAGGEAVETIDSAAPCTHCAVHSRNKRDDSLLQQPNLGQRANDLTTPSRLSIAAPRALQTGAWVAKAHGPPGEKGRLHILINVFRI